MKTKTKTKSEKKTKTKTKVKTKMKKTKIKNKMKITKTRIKMKSFCVFVNFTRPRGATDGQLSLTCPRSAITFSFANFAHGLAVL